MTNHSLTIIAGVFLLGIVFLLTTISDASAAVFLKIGDIKGEATADGHKEWIEVSSVNTLAGQDSKIPQQLTLVKYVDVSSPKIFEALNTGKHYDRVVIDICESSCFQSIKLSDVIITSYSVSSTEDRPQEEVSLKFAKIEYSSLKEPAVGLTPQPAKKLPNWIKNNAEWWAKKQIDDSDFVQGIQYMLKEKIIVIPNLPESSGTQETVVPDWVRNNANWWAKGLISEDDFLNGIKYLVERGIIKV
ncbi:MAG: type VI secretion system tube protein Hcp [Nitrosopumilaceae archaeon]